MSRANAITPDVLAILASGIEVTGTNVVITATLDRDQYAQVNKVLVALGGKWNRSARAHVFLDDPTDRIDQAVLTRTYTNEKQDLQVFYTPPAVVARVIRAASIDPHHEVLEPSAGNGALAMSAAACLRRGSVVTYELRDSGDAVGWWSDGGPANIGPHVGVDFLTVDPPVDLFDRVVMNPPFTRQQDIAHVAHALRFVKPGGRLVSVMSPAFEWRDDAKSVAFRAALDLQEAWTVEKLPAGSFKASGTSIDTVLLTVDRRRGWALAGGGYRRRMGDHFTIENLTIHLHVHGDGLDGDDLADLTTHLTTRLDTIMTTLDEALAAVRHNNDLTDSLISFNATLLAEIREHADDPEKIRAIIAEAEAQAEETAAAIVANTPADPTAPEPTEDPVPDPDPTIPTDGGGTPSEPSIPTDPTVPDAGGEAPVEDTPVLAGEGDSAVATGNQSTTPVPDGGVDGEGGGGVPE